MVGLNSEVPLAKTNPVQTLPEHTAAVWEAAQAMLDALSGWLPPNVAPWLRDVVWLHDVGKASEGFQRMIRGGGSWGHRHELLSAAVAVALQLPDEVILAITTHHRALNDHELRVQSGLDQTEKTWQEHGQMQWSQFVQGMTLHWTWLQGFLQEMGFRKLPDSPEYLPDLREPLARYDKSSIRQLPTQNRQCLLLLRGLMMAADHLASGHYTVPPSLPKPRWEYDWRMFQRRMAEHQGHLIVEAPTGSGKTEGALLWALGNRRAQERIFYILPTQASINAMVERLRCDFGEEALVAPVHARVLQQEFQAFFQGDDYAQAAEEARQRNDLYRQFYAPIKVLTPFQIIKHLFGARYFEIGLAEMTGATVIVDEVHAYDARVQALLEVSLGYLQEQLGARICLMSATIPGFLRQRFQAVIHEATHINAYGDPALSPIRHRLSVLPDSLEAIIPRIVADAARGKRVLVVCNRVDQAQRLYTQLKDASDSCRLLHSRFTYQDRNAIEDEILDHQKRPQVLVATQVVEVSLDISYDVLYTEAAPVDDLLQRFGRVNRYGQAEIADVYVCPPSDLSTLRGIYDPLRVQQTLDRAPNGLPLTHERVQEWLEQVYAEGPTAKEREVYETTKAAMQKVTSDLVPLYESAHGIDFDGLFDAVEVVPFCLQEEYLRRLIARQWLYARELLVPLRWGTLKGLKRKGMVSKADDTYSVSVAYDSQLGLRVGVDETSDWIV